MFYILKVMIIKKVMYNLKKRKKIYVRDTSSDYHCEYGFVKSDDLQKDGIVKTNKDIELNVMPADFSDNFEKIKRAPQIIPRKDIGLILTECGVNDKMIVVEAGSGSGAAGLFLATHCKKLHSFDIREDHLKIAEKNFKDFGIKNVTTKLHDIYTGIPVKNVDLLLLDVPAPWEVIPHAKVALKQGGHFVSYSPTIPQVMDFVNNLDKDFYHVKTIELIQREWEIHGRKVRPKTFQELGHSGFLTFVRKL